MGASDVPVPAHHCRIGIVSPELTSALTGLKGTIVVTHQGGKAGEHPHYHVWFQHERPITAGTVKNRLRKQNEIFATLSGNGDWSFRGHNDLKTWWEYVWLDPLDTKKPALVCWNMDIPQFDIPEIQHTLILNEMATPRIVNTVGPSSLPVQTPKKTTTQDKQNKFLKYCKEYYALDPEEKPTSRRVLKLLYDYCAKNGFTTESCCFVYVNYALSNLLKGDDYKESRRRFTDRLANKYFN